METLTLVILLNLNPTTQIELAAVELPEAHCLAVQQAVHTGSRNGAPIAYVDPHYGNQVPVVDAYCNYDFEG